MGMLFPFSYLLTRLNFNLFAIDVVQTDTKYLWLWTVDPKAISMSRNSLGIDSSSCWLLVRIWCINLMSTQSHSITGKNELLVNIGLRLIRVCSGLGRSIVRLYWLDLKSERRDRKCWNLKFLILWEYKLVSDCYGTVLYLHSVLMCIRM